MGRIGVIGSGAIGCFYGSKLMEVGHEVHFLMRGDLETVREWGLTIRSGGEERNFSQVHIHPDSESIGPCDLILIGLKATANSEYKRLIEPLLGLDTLLLTLQNGLGSDEALGELFGRERIIGGLCFVCLNRVAPGVVEHFGHGTLSIGALQREPHPAVERLVAAFGETGIETKAVTDLAAERWRKLVWNVPFNGLSIAAGGLTVEDILRDENLARAARDLMLEVIAAARALGHRIDAEYADFQIERSRPMGPYRPSSLIDWQAGRPVEVDAIWAEPLRRARKAGVETPRLELLTAILRQLSA